MMRDKREHLEQEVLQYRQQVSALQDRLDSVTKVTQENLNNLLLNCCFTQQYFVCYFACTLTHLLIELTSSFF